MGKLTKIIEDPLMGYVIEAKGLFEKYLQTRLPMTHITKKRYSAEDTKAAEEYALDIFAQAHLDTDFLVSHGSIKKDDPMKTQKIEFSTMDGGLKEITEGKHSEDSSVFKIPWGEIDWDANAFRMGKVWIGRSPNVAIQLVHKNVSKTHGYLKTKGGRVYYADVGSTNGSKVGGKMIQNPLEDIAVESGNIINIGGVKLTFYSAQGFYQDVLNNLKS
ncbi:FHA domain-containing protein [Candidatus Woesearchaeota archaeon]|nr:FHA domain-containing protein [Candidatus Woesearchaeota archaeon]